MKYLYSNKTSKLSALVIKLPNAIKPYLFSSLFAVVFKPLLRIYAAAKIEIKSVSVKKSSTLLIIVPYCLFHGLNCSRSLMAGHSPVNVMALSSMVTTDGGLCCGNTIRSTTRAAVILPYCSRKC